MYVRPGTRFPISFLDTTQTLGALLPDPNTYAAPEIKSSGWPALKKYVTHA